MTQPDSPDFGAGVAAVDSGSLMGTTKFNIMAGTDYYCSAVEPKSVKVEPKSGKVEPKYRKVEPKFKLN